MTKSIPSLIICFAIVAVSLSASKAAQRTGGEKGKEAPNAEKIVGTWRLVKAGTEEVPKGADEITFEFTKDGKMKIKGPEKDEGTYKIEGDKLFLTMTSNGKTYKNSIKSLTADTLSFEDDSKGKTVLIELKKK